MIRFIAAPSTKSDHSSRLTLEWLVKMKSPHGGCCFCSGGDREEARSDRVGDFWQRLPLYNPPR